jgi:uncharacterized delta-60 repeat protein
VVRRSVLVVAVALQATFSPATAGGAGSLDPSWRNDGIVITTFGLNAGANAVAIQEDGKVVVAGRALDPDRFAIARYGPRGRRDRTFGGDGRVETNVASGFESAEDVELQSNGKVVVAGWVTGTLDDFALVRYRGRGGLDPHLGGDGIVTTNFAPAGPDAANALVLLSSGKIILAGSACGAVECVFALARYLPNGSLDPAFGGDGRVKTRFASSASATDVAVQADGRLVVVGQAGNLMAVARYGPDGSLDDSFSGNGKLMLSVGADQQRASGVALEGDGSIVIAGGGHNSPTPDVFEPLGFVVVRLDPTGIPDPAFGGGDGIVLTPFQGEGHASDVAIQEDGKILAMGSGGGDFGSFSIARYETGGSLDPSFAGDGKATPCVCGFFPSPTALAIQPNGKIVMVGHTDTFNIDSQFAVLRVLA